MAVQRQAHIEKNFRGRARISKPAHHVQQEAHQRDAGEQRDDHDQGVRVASQQTAIDQGFREIRQHQRKRGTQQAEHQHQHQPAPVRKRVMEQRLSGAFRHDL